jgi:hypothetical protein
MSYLTNEQWIVLAVIFGAGLILGLLLRSGGSKWRRLYNAEHDAHVALRRDYDKHLANHNNVRAVDDRDTLRSGSF